MSRRLKRAASDGNEPRPKIGSRYIHLRCILFNKCKHKSKSVMRFSQINVKSLNCS